MVQVVLDGIVNIIKMAGNMLEDVVSAIESCGGLNLIEDLQHNANPSIFKSAYTILEMLYGSVSHRLTPFSFMLGTDFHFNFRIMMKLVLPKKTWKVLFQLLQITLKPAIQMRKLLPSRLKPIICYSTFDFHTFWSIHSVASKSLFHISYGYRSSTCLPSV